MADSLLRRSLHRLFGDEGTVALEAEMQIVMVSTAMAVAGFFLLSPIVSDLAGPFGVTGAETGQLITALTAPSIVLVPVMGILADRIGRKQVLVAGLVIFGTAGPGVGLTSSFEVALGLRLVQGVGFAAMVPICVAILGDVYEGARETTAQGLRTAGIQVVSLVSPPLAGLLIIGSWRYPFFLYAIALPLALWAWVTLPETGVGGSTSLAQYGRNLASTLREPAMAAILLSFTIRFFMLFGFFAFVSVLLRDVTGATAVAVGITVSLHGLVTLITSTQIGRMMASRDPFLVLLVGFLVSGIGMTFLGIGRSYPTLLLAALVMGAGSGVAGPLQKSLVNQLSPPNLRAGSVSSALVFQSIGQTGGPLLMGLALQWYSVLTTFLVVGIVGGIASVVVTWVAYRSSETPLGIGMAAEPGG